jgi:ATP-NAD kinase N-terminal domain
MGGLLGLLVNPVAGMGGRVGLHGTDCTFLLAEARRRGAVPVTGPRTSRALRCMAGRDLSVLAAPGPMGADIALICGLPTMALDLEIGPGTTAADTQRAARALADAGVALLLFAGGDGTAGDIVRAVGERVPLLGIPSGVKMHSGVFAPTPETAGQLAAEFLAAPTAPLPSPMSPTRSSSMPGPYRSSSAGRRASRGSGPAAYLGPRHRRCWLRPPCSTPFAKPSLENSSRAFFTYSGPGRRREGSWRSSVCPTRRSVSMR